MAYFIPRIVFKLFMSVTNDDIVFEQKGHDTGRNHTTTVAVVYAALFGMHIQSNDETPWK